jgi:uncharacterized protein YndB with AHSA1/START domain
MPRIPAIPAAIALLAALAVPSGFAQTNQQGSVSVTRTASPEKRLDFQVTVPGTPAAVWEALTTSQGLVTWLWRDAQVDLRVGGEWLVKFPDTTGGGTITAFVPMQRLEISALAPERFPNVRRDRTRAVFELRPAADGKSTVVHLSQTGWKSGQEWDSAYDYLAKGNAELLEDLRQRFVTGPFDWDAIMKAAQKQQPSPDTKNH